VKMPEPNAASARAGHRQGDQFQAPPRPRRLAGMVWCYVGGWLSANTFAPSWLPARLRHPAFSYLAAVVLEGVASLLTLLLLVSLPSYGLPDLLTILGVVLVALTWGGGPSLVATLVGLLLLEALIFPPQFSWSPANATDAISDGLVLGVGILISLVAGQMARARRQTEQARQVAEVHAAHLGATLEALAEAKSHLDTFVGIVSHELRTPLTALNLSLQITQRRLQHHGQQTASPREVGSTIELVQDHLAQTEHHLERIERLVDDLLDASRIQAGKLDLRRKCVDLATILLTAVEGQRRAAQHRTITLQLPADLPVPVQVDPGRIEQVVTNYLTNALKYSPADRPVAVGMQVGHQQVQIWVRDEGPGLPKEEQERIWERFHRTKGIEVQDGTGIGLGLGLHICRMIIEQHGGQVGVQSAPGTGATFWLKLPLGEGCENDASGSRNGPDCL
jgi:signal transduction histidine kinase